MIIQKNEKQIELIKKACRIVAEVLELVGKNIRIGISTKELDTIAYEYITNQGATPSFLGYDGFPASICASVNDAVVHGFPSEYTLKNGDIIGIDVGACYRGYHGDAARTFVVGNVSAKVQKLVDVTRKSFYKGIKGLKSGDKVGKISNQIETFINEFGYGIVKELVGHGVGADIHEDPMIPNYGRANSGPILPVNCVIAVEPMINLGTSNIEILSDDWTVVTADGKPSAHYENTLLVTENGVEILTLLNGEEVCEV